MFYARKCAALTYPGLWSVGTRSIGDLPKNYLAAVFIASDPYGAPDSYMVRPLELSAFGGSPSMIIRRA